MIKVVDILKALEKVAPVHLAADYDNVGFIVGHKESPADKIIVALDITGDVIDEAIQTGARLIVSHHPIIFGSRSTVTDCDVTGALVLKLIENGISAICMHTNLDSAKGGVNDALAEALGTTADEMIDRIPRLSRIDLKIGAEEREELIDRVAGAGNYANSPYVISRSEMSDVYTKLFG